MEELKQAVRRKSVIRLFKGRFFLRFHMFLILLGTFLSGLLATKLLLILNVNRMSIRYPLAVLFSYLAFFVFMRIWLWYVRSGRGNSAGDAVDAVPDVPGFSDGFSGEGLRGGVETFGGGGGTFGGGGASGAFDESPSAAFDDAVTGLTSDACGGVSGAAAAEADEGVMGAVAEGAGEAVSGVLEGGGIVLLILAVALAAVYGTGIYMIYEAPAILSEVAFELVLATGLAKSARRLDAPEWLGSVLKTTWKPFLGVVLLSFAVSLAASYFCPSAKSVKEALFMCTSIFQ